MSEQVSQRNRAYRKLWGEEATALANRLIPDQIRNGRILDIGCGSYRYFLSNTYFRKRHGVDRFAGSAAATAAGIRLHDLDLQPFLWVAAQKLRGPGSHRSSR